MDIRAFRSPEREQAQQALVRTRVAAIASIILGNAFLVAGRDVDLATSVTGATLILLGIAVLVTKGDHYALACQFIVGLVAVVIAIGGHHWICLVLAIVAVGLFFRGLRAALTLRELKIAVETIRDE